MKNKRHIQFSTHACNLIANGIWMFYFAFVNKLNQKWKKKTIQRECIYQTSKSKLK